MDWTTLLFSFNGRINRGKYWLVYLVFVPIFAVVFLLLFFVRGNFPYFAIGAAFLACCYSLTVAAIKRLHDRDKSGWWLLLFWGLPTITQGYQLLIAEMAASNITWYVDLIISLWFYVETGFLPGTSGTNRYGLDPLDSRALASAG
jgi:uncharacterized membrane protein YhaH (DUF805 family)